MYEAVIGLEVHIELKTDSKIFCSCSTAFGAAPNSQVCPVCLGMPGALPVLNKRVLEFAILAGLSTNCKITRFGRLDRKNYFYPDMPKAYQVSQADFPICRDGYIEIETTKGSKRIRIRQSHIEEDAGKLVHEGDTISCATGSLVDLNRAGVPLIEIVSYPDIKTADEAIAYLDNLKAIIQYLGISDCKMEEGSLRCDGNISVRLAGTDQLNPKTEVKNVNSFKTLHKALEYEAARQIKLMQKGERVLQETRTWDEAKGITISMRSKEDPDYRFFTDTELPNIRVDDDWLNKLKQKIPELPQEKKKRFIRDYKLPEYDAEVLTKDKDLGSLFDEVLEEYHDPKKLSNWIMAEYLRLINVHQLSIADSPIEPKGFAELLELVDQGKISGKIAKEVFEEMFASGKAPGEIIQKKGLVQISDEWQLKELAKRIIADNPKSVEDYRGGQKKAIGFLMGQVMKETKGQANPQLVNKILKKMLQD